MYVAAEEATQYAPPTSDMQFQHTEKERGLVHVVQAVAEQSTSSSMCNSMMNENVTITDLHCEG